MRFNIIEEKLFAIPALMINSYFNLITALKVSVFGDFPVRIFPHLDRIQRDTEYLSLFSPNAGKYGPEKLQIRTLFTHCTFLFSYAFLDSNVMI